jgi:hypothetical protein
MLWAKKEERKKERKKDARCILGVTHSIGFLILANIQKCLLLLEDDLLSKNMQVYVAFILIVRHKAINLCLQLLQIPSFKVIYGISGNHNAILQARNNRKEERVAPSLKNKHLLAKLLNSFQENKLRDETKGMMKIQTDRKAEKCRKFTLLDTS